MFSAMQRDKAKDGYGRDGARDVPEPSRIEGDHDQAAEHRRHRRGNSERETIEQAGGIFVGQDHPPVIDGDG